MIVNQFRFNLKSINRRSYSIRFGFYSCSRLSRLALLGLHAALLSRYALQQLVGTPSRDTTSDRSSEMPHSRNHF